MRCKIVEDHAVTEAIGRAYEVFERTDDAMGAISFALERDPKSAGFESEEAPGTYWLFRPGKPSIKFPAVTVVYTLTHETVWLRSVRLEHDGVIFHSAAFEKARNAS